MMRLRGDVDQKVLGELFYQYMNVEEDFISALFINGETQLGRIYVQEPALVGGQRAARAGLRTRQRGDPHGDAARDWGVLLPAQDGAHGQGLRRTHGYLHDLQFQPADSLTRHGYARAVDVSEGLDLLQQAYDHNLVQFGENVREGVNFICNCCGCCCEAMIAARQVRAC